MSIYVTDTHPLVWFARGHHTRLSTKVLRVFRDAEQWRKLIYVPAVVLWEIAILLKMSRVRLLQPFSQWTELLLAKQGFELAPLDPQVIGKAMQFSFNADPFDPVIVATAELKDLPLITRDQQILNARIVEVVW
jgi:PIN domain nuclease of toxin-antitoxin system